MFNARPNAPFRAPRLLNSNDRDLSSQQTPSSSSQLRNSQITNKRRILSTANGLNSIKKPKSDIELPQNVQEPSSKLRYTVQWRKRTNKKNKTWDGDGYIVVLKVNPSSYTISFKSLENNMSMKKSFSNIDDFDAFLTSTISIGQIEFEIDYKITSDAEFRSFIGEDSGTSPEPSSKPEPIINLVHSTKFKSVIPAPSTKVSEVEVLPEPTEVSTNFIEQSGISDSIILPRPPNSESKDIIDVIIDPQLALKLRPHQVEAVKFLYECVMGFKDFKGNGGLLADEMGLGKTLTTISLIWTLYKQNPFKNQTKPIIKKVLVCCPATLINNWRNEFKKWLGLNKIGILDFNSLNVNTEKEKQNIISFGKYNIYNVLIINYEKISTHIKELSTVKFDLLICDEGHKLKNNSGKVLKNLKILDIPKRVLLTGTPIQNNLTEFHTVIDFVNPGILGDYKTFQKNYLLPIQKAREINCLDPAVKKKGRELSDQLILLTKMFTLRRTQSILDNYLTIKTDIILFVKPTKLQQSLFHHILHAKGFNQLLSDSQENSNTSLALINTFRKICNSPLLLRNDEFFNRLKAENNQLAELKLDRLSGKINILIPLMLEIIKADEKIVLISNFTQTLDLLENEILNPLNIVFLRLDGSTPKQTRNKLINEFNRSSTIPVFLLSSKSGGMGINLVGASRLILFDNDWNPAVDLQSMARIHRDGQEKPCFIYRILTTGCIDEKIFQRQIMKNNLSSKFLDNDSKSVNDVFDAEDLRNLFEIDTETSSNTHDLIECECIGDGSYQYDSQEADDEEEGSFNEENEVPQSQYMSALELHQRVGDNVNVAKKRIIRNTLSHYKHIDPKQNNLQVNDKILKRIIKKKNGYSPDGNEFPLAYIMSKTTESSEDLDLDKDLQLDNSPRATIQE
ncbi:P-loop containing nucleoside triphosphate hydrolase protein [Scheffersomyces amazonensis]|uniref:P-loop containing nucleoside triphosphate hydrolase protein n=1 Tax=Scheffersomyces amazonensis TaxID=1078765 RepID=UPI00315CBEE3